MRIARRAWVGQAGKAQFLTSGGISARAGIPNTSHFFLFLVSEGNLGHVWGYFLAPVFFLRHVAPPRGGGACLGRHSKAQFSDPRGHYPQPPGALSALVGRHEGTEFWALFSAKNLGHNDFRDVCACQAPIPPMAANSRQTNF